MRVLNSYVWGLDFFRFEVTFLTFMGYKFLRLVVIDSYVWGLDFLRLGVTNHHV